LAPVGAADAPPAGRRPGRHQQPRATPAGLRRVRVSAVAPRYPYRLRSGHRSAPAVARPARRQRRAHAGDRALPWLGAPGDGPLGNVPAARDLDQDTLDRRRRVLGDDHPDTLRSATQLATDLRELGEVQAARDLDQDTLDRKRQILGEDHPDTLISASNLALDLRILGQSGSRP